MKKIVWLEGQGIYKSTFQGWNGRGWINNDAIRNNLIDVGQIYYIIADDNKLEGL